MVELNECIRYLNEYCNFHFLPAWKGETVKLHTVFERPQNIILFNNRNLSFDLQD